ncbi:histone-fold-containing protein [Polyplosphaeria fusca]|uniref:DNA polymerase epsilon subunit D n=1 Tax=Polyplosphaeria fusca TaxID=682080 RepID=A0A9P4RAZ1_9PLEO|nr:histone-fold-containing protein [Polyplosphaeria fusca]
MPAKKSNPATGSPEDSAKAASKEDGLSVEDLNLPKSIVQRLAKGVLPPNTQIQKDALLAMSKSATVFVNYVTSQAAENAARTNHKTVTPQDVYNAMLELEFDSFLPRLEAEVAKFTSIQADKRNSYRAKVRQEKKAMKTANGDATKAQPLNGHGGEDESPPTKRTRRSSVDNGEHAEGSADDDDQGDADDTIEVGEEEPEDEELEDDEVEDEPAGEELAEDPIEEKEVAASDDDMGDGDESD